MTTAHRHAQGQNRYRWHLGQRLLHRCHFLYIALSKSVHMRVNPTSRCRKFIVCCRRVSSARELFASVTQARMIRSYPCLCICADERSPSPPIYSMRWWQAVACHFQMSNVRKAPGQSRTPLSVLMASGSSGCHITTRRGERVLGETHVDKMCSTDIANLGPLP